ncbi:hypothetical protein PHLCEN_2v4748 [Hermanssonia centrifuga]|uniref:Uncharacterized protein n=1 Tax=Hermanssonia centrifuga TaxID=98765 RepID=A0A2R6PJA2_9APHY|nr:hypothetical protein PHLCEN_2v4748 [Hermanssonia centrifuga]
MLRNTLCRGYHIFSSKHILRSFASVSSSSSLNPNSVGPFQVFDRKAKVLQKDRAVSKDNGETSRTVDYVRDEVADRVIERLLASSDILQVLLPDSDVHLGHQAKV